jgi:hypothetical protein
MLLGRPNRHYADSHELIFRVLPRLFLETVAAAGAMFATAAMLINGKLGLSTACRWCSRASAARPGVSM